MECSVHLVNIHVYLFHGHARTRRQCHTAAQKLRWDHWTLVWEWKDYLRKSCWILWRIRQNLLSVDGGKTVLCQLTPKTLKDRQEFCDIITPSITCTSHLSASVFFLILEASRFNASRDLASKRGVKTKSSEESWQLRANFMVLRRPNGWIFREPQEGQEAKPPTPAKSTSTSAKLGKAILPFSSHCPMVSPQILCCCVTLWTVSCMPMKVSLKRNNQIYKNISSGVNFESVKSTAKFASWMVSPFLFLFMAFNLCR